MSVNIVSILKYVAYYRVSTKRQGRSGLGLEAQQKAVRGMAERNGAVIIAEYIEVETGKSASRPKLLEAIHHAALTNATLVVAKLDRLARNAYFTRTLKESKQKFTCCDNEHANDLSIDLLAVIAEHEGAGQCHPYPGGPGGHKTTRQAAGLRPARPLGRAGGSAGTGSRKVTAPGLGFQRTEGQGPLPDGARTRDQAPPRSGRVPGDDRGLAQCAGIQDAPHETLPGGRRLHAEDGLAAD